MKRWQWWTVVVLVVVLVAAIFAANRYTMQCVAVAAGRTPLVCSVLDRWTGKVQPEPR